ncbi:MAG TPA: glycosyltransferase family 2 protein [Thermoanaerobaculia bacterium]|nr:glycosyltransferase family 2 protein [Thermoanaerobaculia bacterium]
MHPRVSVLIPAYNAARWVVTAIESVRAQSFDDWEIVAVDDSSTDDTHAILERFKGPRVSVERNAKNLGMTGNWNRCLSLAKGDLVLKLDADDALKPRALELLAAPLEETDVLAAGIRSLQCDEELEPFDGIQGDDAMQRHGIDPYRDSIHSGDYWYDFAAVGYQLWSSSAFLARRAFVQSTGGWDERFGCAADSELMWRTLEAGRPVAHRGAVGALYRVRPGSISDEYRSRGWLTWEAVAANLLSLSRVRKQRPLRRALRMHYVRQWDRWQSSPKTLPDAICGKLDDVMRAIPEPPLSDRVMTRVRDAVSTA